MENIVVIAPCYNEEKGINLFLNSIEKVCRGVDKQFKIIIIDDGSTDQTPQILKDFTFNTSNSSLTVLQLDVNVGHQQAILQGLLYAKNIEANKFIVMDSDGQDDVALIPEMIGIEGADIVHILRKKRKESLLFRFCYKVYKFIFKLITRQSIHFGNYCLINKKVLLQVTSTGFIHFPAFLSSFVQRKKYITADRKKRTSGKSKMTYLDLFNHAIKSFVQHADQLLTVCLWLFIILAVTLLVYGGHVMYKKFFTDKAILGWASTVIIGLFNGMLIMLSTFVIGTQLLKNSYAHTIYFRATVVKENHNP